jgi:hypothetical protein
MLTRIFAPKYPLPPNSMAQNPWKAIVTQLVKKFRAFYGTRRFVTLFSRASRRTSILSRVKPTYTPKFYLLTIHFNILPFTPWSPKSSLSVRFSDKNCILLTSTWLQYVPSISSSPNHVIKCTNYKAILIYYAYLILKMPKLSESHKHYCLTNQ